MRNVLTVCSAVFLLYVSAVSAAEEKKVVVVYQKKIRIQAIVADGVLSKIPNAEIQDISEMSLGSCDSDIAAVVPIGRQALDAAIARCKETPVVFSLVSAPRFQNYRRFNNVTGIAFDLPMRMFLSEMKKFLPPGSKIGFLFSTDVNDHLTSEMNFIEGEFGFVSIRKRMNPKDDIGKHIKSLIEDKKIAVFWVLPDPIYNQGIFKKLAELCASKGVLLVTNFEPLVSEAGAAIALAPSYFETGAQTAQVVQEILKGKKPEDFPFQSPEKTGVYLNQKIFASFKILLPNELKYREKVTALVNEGQALLKEGKTENALSKFKEALKYDKKNEVANYFINSTNAKENYQIALTRLESGNKIGALPYLASASLYLSTARAKLYSLRGELKSQLPSILEKGIREFKSKKFNECLNSMNLVLMIEPGHKEAAIYKEKAGKRAKAISAIK